RDDTGACRRLHQSGRSAHLGALALAPEQWHGRMPADGSGGSLRHQGGGSVAPEGAADKLRRGGRTRHPLVSRSLNFSASLPAQPPRLPGRTPSNGPQFGPRTDSPTRVTEHPVSLPAKTPAQMSVAEKKSLGKGLFRKCGGCGSVLTAEQLAASWEVCPQCGHHHPMSARAWRDLLLDDSALAGWDEHIAPSDPLGFH